MPGIPQNFIDLVRSSSDIVQIIQGYVPLKATGSSFKGLCPFHNEKTPSFHVEPQRQIFHCFGCNEGGDVFKFIMLYDKLSFIQVVEQLATQAGIKLPNVSGNNATQDQELRVLYKLQEEAAKFFQKQLHETKDGEKALTYLLKRGLNEQTIRAYSIGFAPDTWTALLKHLTSQGAHPKHIERAGFAVPRKSKDGFYDRFRKRIMIPITSVSGRIVAFGGRMLGTGEPKYLNSPESPIYHKGSVLFGFQGAKEAIRKKDSAILMEGYMDCLQAYQGGIKEAIACCGTSLTKDHVRLLKRYTERVIINFDPDSAGIKATRRTTELLLEEGFDVQVLTLPKGLDPDGYIRSKGSEQYLKLIAKSSSFVSFLIREASTRYDVDTPRGKAKFLGDLLPILGKIPDRVERIGYVGPLAEHVGITDGAVLDELQRHIEKKEISRFELPTSGSTPVKLAERELIRWILSSSDNYTVLDEIKEQDLEGLTTAPILRIMKKQKNSGELTTERLLDQLKPDELRKQFTRILTDPSPLSPRQSALDCLNGLRKERLKLQLSQLRAKLSLGVDEDKLTAEILSLARQIETLGKVETRA